MESNSNYDIMVTMALSSMHCILCHV